MRDFLFTFASYEDNICAGSAFILKHERLRLGVLRLNK